MTKTKKGIVSGLAVLSLAVCVAGAALGGNTFRASAAEAFSADAEGSAVYPGGKTKDAVLGALNKKVEELNADIQAVLDEGGDLATAYAEGEIIAYSNRNGGIINGENKRSGWKVWEGAAVLDLKFINKGYDGWNDNSVAWLSYNGATDKAYIITAEFAASYGKDGNQKLGSAAGDMFRVNGEGGGYVTYQNFTNGYMKLENGNVEVVNKKNVDEDGTEKDADPASTGFVGAATEDTLKKAGVPAEQFAQTFTEAYNKYKAEGINVGYPFSPVMDNGKNSGGDTRYGTLCSQNFRWGDSVCDPWNDAGRSQWSALAYNFEEGRVYLIADEFWHQFEGVASGDVLQLGDPTSDAFVAGGDRYQNFEKGYMKADGTAPQKGRGVTVVLNKTVASDGTVSDIDMQSKIGKLGKTVTDSVIPDGYTAETFSAAIKNAYAEKVAFYEDETLSGVDLTSYENGLLSQSYTDGKGQVHKLVYSKDIDGFVYLRPAVVSKMNGLGAPTAHRVLVAQIEKSEGEQTIYAYPFERGYIRLSVKQEITIEDGAVVTVTNETAVATQGATYDSENGFFATTSYSDSINADMVSADVLSAAYWDGCWNLEKPTKEQIAAAFKTAYDEAYALGFSAGSPSGEGICWWTTGQSGIIKLTLSGGNGNGNFFNDNTLISYNPQTGKAYITTGAVASGYASDGASGNGWATTEMMINTATGVIVQQFKIIDPVVERDTYIIVDKNGLPQKVEGVYDFQANKGDGEWVEYLTQFGGSISSAPLNEKTVYAKGAKVEIDFAKYVANEDGYTVKWNKVSGKGTLSSDGKYTLDAMTADGDTVEVEVYSAFDKLSFKLTLSVEQEGNTPGNNPGGNPGDNTPGNTPDNSDKDGGLSAGAIAGICVGAAAVVGLGAGAYFIIRKKKK